jgi:tetratricopeptide (TPR) repeat protein
MNPVFRNPRTELDLSSPWRAALFVMCVSVVSGILGWEAARTAGAETLLSLRRPYAFRWALALDPDNSEIHERLGQYCLYSMEYGDLEEAVRQLRRAAELNPWNAAYWFDLGTGCGTSGNETCADSAFERAVRLSPMTPRFEWGWALELLASGQQEEALPHLRRVLALDGSYAPAVFRVSPGALSRPQSVLRNLLPPAGPAQLKLDYLNFLCAQGKLDAAYFVWTQALARDAAIPFASAGPFLNQLIDHSRVREATVVWQDLKASGIVPGGRDGDPSNLVYDGDFALTPLNAGFGWRVQRSPYVEVSFRSLPSPRGNRGLRIDFTVPRNDELTPVFQYVVVRPHTRYLLRVRARTANISSDSGPRLRIVDALCDQCLDVSTESSVGTSSTREVTAKFETGESTELVRLEVWRPRTVDYPAEITGTFWLADVSLRTAPLAPATGLAQLNGAE